MVRNDGGQLYTIEGFAAALIMVITAYLVVNATSVYTAGDTHINDMQLETMGSDALIVMSTPMNSLEKTNGYSVLQSILKEDPDGMNTNFGTNFTELVNSSGINKGRDVQFIANYTCRKTDNSIPPRQPLSNSTHGLTGTEHPVRVTKWIIVEDPNICGRSNAQAVLVEVLLWLD